MDNGRLTRLKVALESERLTMKRQELLRQIWRVCRNNKQASSVPGQSNQEGARHRERPGTQPKSRSSAGGKLPPQSASISV